jgi:hypothetical protein
MKVNSRSAKARRGCGVNRRSLVCVLDVPCIG